MEEALRSPLTLVAAPAGFGKTTLVTASLDKQAYPVAWLSLDHEDNQAGRFLTYLVAALQVANEAVGDQAAQMLEASQPAPLDAVLTCLINDLEDAGKEMVLVLDDYQYLQSQAVQAAVVFLLEHLPSTLHLVIITRSDPPLPLARLRARSQMVELRAADLRFTTLEAAQFLNECMGLRLDENSVAVLEERTEGWIAGLQMAALSMRDRDDKRSFIDNFSGTHRYILDYLLEEVLANQTPEIQRFLLFTSILERLTAPLCDVILKDPTGDSSIVLTPSFVILDDLERANLFLVPLDDERRWYRYHHLFADLLRARLDQSYPGLARQLHARAAAWLEKEELTVEAINHALAAGKNDQAARLVEENTTCLLAKGELTALMGWIEALPVELHLSRPWLSIHQAYALVMAGRLDGVPPLLAKVEAAIETGSTQNEVDLIDRSSDRPASPALVGETQMLKGAVTTIRAMLAVMTGQDMQAVSLSQQARQLLPAENLWDRAAAAWALGYAQRSLGHYSEACAAFEEQIRLGRAVGNIWTLVTGLNDLGLVLQAQGKLRQARALFEEGLAEASHQGARSLGFIARLEAGLGSVLYEQNELEAASRLLTDAIIHTRLWPNPNHLAYAYALHSRLLLARGDLRGARASMAEADLVRRSAVLTRLNRRRVETDLIRVWLAVQAAGRSLDPGDQLNEQAEALVKEWQAELAKPVDNTPMPMDEVAVMTAISLARVFITNGQVEAALSLLDRAAQSARAAEHRGGLISSLLLSAIARKSTAANSTGAAALEEALSLAEPGGYVRVFVDEGEAMRLLIADYSPRSVAEWDCRMKIEKHKCDQDHKLIVYADKLLAAFSQPVAEPQTTADHQKSAISNPTPLRSGDNSQQSTMVEPLSRRELEVLHLLALGRTNQEICAQLVTALGTVKAQTASIYRKLEVTNRTEAVARARQLGILP